MIVHVMAWIYTFVLKRKPYYPLRNGFNFPNMLFDFDLIKKASLKSCSAWLATGVWTRVGAMIGRGGVGR